MKKEIIIEVPKNWSAITLRKYLELQADIKAYEGEDEALLAAMFYHLCGMTPDILAKLDTETFIKIKEQLLSFYSKADIPLVIEFARGGIEYGFYPNLSKIEYGAYLDISKLSSTEINEDWAKIMAILYRPIKKKIGKMYEVANYTGEEDSEWFLDIGMDIHLGAWFFFINLSMELLRGTLNSTMKTAMELAPNIKSILEKSGATIPL
jgi:hypothetical protein